MSWEAGVVLRVIATAVQRSLTATRAATIASLRVAQHLGALIGAGLAKDAGELKQDHLQKSRAEATTANAKAMREMAAAIEAANEETRRQDRHQAEMQILRAKARAADAMADVVEAEAASTVIKIAQDDGEAIPAAAARLHAAIQRLNEKGGALYVAPAELPKDAAHDVGKVKIVGSKESGKTQFFGLGVPSETAGKQTDGPVGSKDRDGG